MSICSVDLLLEPDYDSAFLKVWSGLVNTCEDEAD